MRLFFEPFLGFNRFRLRSSNSRSYSLACLKAGEKGIISSISCTRLQAEMLSFGLSLGDEVHLYCKAPFGGPICVSIKDCRLFLRLQEAQKIALKHVA